MDYSMHMGEGYHKAALATQTFIEEDVQEEVEVRKMTPNRLLLFTRSMPHAAFSVFTHILQRRALGASRGSCVRERGDVDLRATYSLRGNLLTRPAAQVL